MTETAPERLGAIRTALRELVGEHGSELLSSPARMSNLIKDLLPDDQQLVRILVIAAEQDVASKLREHGSQGMDAATATRLVATSFAASTMFDRQACLLVVGELAVAMGLASGESTTPVISDGGATPEVRGPVQASVQVLPLGAGASSSGPTPVLVPSDAVAAAAAVPRPRSRRGLYLALAATTVVIAGAAVILGIEIGSSPPASHGPISPGPTSPAASPAPASGPESGDFVIGRRFLNDGSLILTLTTIKLRGGLMTVNVTYRSATGGTEVLSCLGDSRPSIASITLADGTVIQSSATYCSDHPAATFTVEGGQTHTSYAVFRVSPGFPEPFSFSWPADNTAGTVSNISI